MARLTQAVYINLGDSPAEPGADVVILVDDSGSMAPFADAVRQALRDFVGRLPAGTRVGLASFGTALRVLCRPTDCAEFLLDQIDRFKAESGGTALFDAIGEAASLFEESSRLRALVLLTDCDDGGSTRFSEASLQGELLERQVRLLVIRLGAGSSGALERLARATGGGFLPGRTWDDVNGAIRGASLSAVGAPVSLRAEFTKLATLRDGAWTPWLRQLSLDAWDAGGVEALDEGHLRFPKGAEGLLDSHVKLEAELIRVLKAQLASSSRDSTALADSDLTLFISGWADDPDYLLVAPLVSACYERVVESLGLTRTVYPVYVPLVRGLNDLSQDQQALCWAWFSAVFNCETAVRPKVVLPCADRNRHASLNPQGFQSETSDVVVLQAANLLWTLSDDPGLVTALSSGPALKVGGAASLATPSEALERKRVFEILHERVRVFADPKRPPDRGVTDQAQPDVEAWRLRLGTLIEDAAQPLSEGVSDVRLDPTDFWPPPRGADRDAYPQELVALLEERGAARQVRRLGFLIRRIAETGRKILEAAKGRIAEKTDQTLFLSDGADLATSLEYLRRLRVELEEEARKVAPGMFAAEIARAGLFSPAVVGMKTATVSPDVALAGVRDLLENRPLPEAMALRHSSLALLAAGAAYLAFLYVPRLALDLGFLHLPVVAAAAAGLVGGGFGFYRWNRFRQMLWKRISEYLLALENQAFQRAVQECTDQVRDLYAQLCAWIGDKTESGAWAPPNVRTETGLTQMQLVAGFGEYLEAAFGRMEAAISVQAASRNPFVIEFGADVPDFTTKPPGSRRIPDGMSVVSLDWAALGASSPWHVRWRECLRRKQCDSLEEYVDFHERRVRVPGGLHDAAVRLLTPAVRQAGSVEHLVQSCDTATLSAILSEMERRSFPPIALDMRIASPPVIGEFTISDPKAIAAIRKRQSGALPTNGAAGDHSLDGVDRLHRFRLYSSLSAASELVDWAACQKSWAALDPQDRRALLSRWLRCGDPVDWVDPGTGERIFPPASEAAQEDVTEGEGLI